MRVPTPTPPPAAGQEPAEAAIIRSMEGFFDAAWYLTEYPDVAHIGVDPIQHFVHHGISEQRNPNAFFDNAWYARHYRDVGASNMLPLLHYLSIGATEKRNPHPRFDAVWYVDEYPEAAANPLVYHMRVGRQRGHPTERPLDIRNWMPSAETLLLAPAKRGVDVIVPVYRGLEETRACLDSVLADNDRLAGSIIVIDDRSPEPRLSAWLDSLARRGTIKLIRNRVNLGFVASVNIGMRTANPGHDVVLLNSDTVVPAGWSRRLAAHAWSDPRVATVSPFSNNATICGYPRDRGWDMPFGLAVGELDAICQGVNAGRSISVPTTVGFCMYIRRDALDAVGPFDEQAFGRGYGEENDFCLRATALGWSHRLACDIFVQHKGAVSFADEAEARSEEGQRTLLARYPDYQDIISRHVRADAVGSCRFVVTAAIFRRSGLPVILLVCHDLGGGVRRHIDLLVHRMDGRAHFLLLAASERGVALSVPAIPGHAELVLPEQRMDDLLQVLRLANVQRAHIHHLAGVDLDIRTLIHRLDVPFDVTVHDHFAICPQVNLLPWPEAAYCGEPAPATCNACIAERSSHGATNIHSWRLEKTWLFHEADRVLCPSADVRDRLIRYGLGGRAIVVPHDPVPSGKWVVRPPRPAKTLRVAFIGVLANHKGALMVAALAAVAAASGIEITLIGHTEAGFPKEARPMLHETGEYDDADLPDLLARIKPHVVWFPSPWPETYSYTLSAALAAELPIIATRIGSFPERLAERPLTWVVPPTQSVDDWLTCFATVREALRKARSPTIGPERSGTADFYGDSYLVPPLVPPLAPVSRRTDRVMDLRQPGRISVVVIPERIGSGLLSPCAYIRLLLPLDHPAIADDMDVVVADAETACRYRADVIVTQRHAISDDQRADALIAHARATGAALLYDMDDDLLNIPRGHADAAELRPKASTVRRMIQGASHVWVSTDTLRDRVRPIQPSVTVIPNGLDERLWLHHPPHLRRAFGPVRIVYMGSATHADDLAIIAPALARLKRDFGRHVECEIVGVTTEGTLPTGVERVGPSGGTTSAYPGFVHWITTIPNWDIGLAPLADTAFNHAKSSIKSYDYAALGLAVLASDMRVYQGCPVAAAGGGLVANDPDAWYGAISRLIRDPAYLAQRRDAARHALRETGTLASQATLRRQAWAALTAQPAAKATRRRARG